MNHFHIWCSLKEGVAERDFAGRVQEFLSDLHARELCEGYSIARREVAMVPPELGRFHILLDFATTAQMSAALAFVSEPSDDTAELHQLVTDGVRSLQTALYRDYPEAPPRRPISL